MSGIGGVARAAPDSVALVAGARQITYAELDERQGLVAGLLLGAGLRAGDRIAVVTARRAETLEVTIGALRAAIVPVPLNPLLTPGEMEYIVEDSGARWLFTDRVLEPPPGLERVVTFGAAYDRLLAETTPARIADHARGRPMHYTSGTTGRPKGVWVDPCDEEQAAALSNDFRSYWDLRSEDVHLVCSPLAHSAPHRYTLRTLEAGGVVVLPGRFDADEALAAIELFGVTTTFTVPTHLERMVAARRGGNRHDVSSMRMLMHAGAPIREATKRAVIEMFPEGSVWEFYGSTEGHFTRISTPEWLDRPGSVGTPRPGASIVILDEHGRAVPEGETGTVWLRDPKAERFRYWGDDAKTAAAWRDGMFSVGDHGRLDAGGYLYLTGRGHDVIITGGVNVYPQEVEDVLAAHPSVAEVMVYGAPDDEWGQRVQAMIVPAFGQPLDLDALHRWARERLAGFKCPKVFEVVGDLPRTATGKPKRPSP